jgi:hypothetical protein
MDLPLNGRAVELVTFSPFTLWLRLPDPATPETSSGTDYVLRIDGPFRLVSAGAVIEVDPESGPDAVYLALLQKTVEVASAIEDGSLAITFVGETGSRSRLTCTNHGNSPERDRHW